MAVAPGGADEGGAGGGGEAGFGAVEEGDDRIHGGLAGEVVVLIHAGPVFAAAAELELHEAEVGGHAGAEGVEPLAHDGVEREDDVGAVGAAPVGEERRGGAGGLDLEERR